MSDDDTEKAAAQAEREKADLAYAAYLAKKYGGRRMTLAELIGECDRQGLGYTTVEQFLTDITPDRSREH